MTNALTFQENKGLFWGCFQSRIMMTWLRFSLYVASNNKCFNFNICFKIQNKNTIVYSNTILYIVMHLLSPAGPYNVYIIYRLIANLLWLISLFLTINLSNKLVSQCKVYLEPLTVFKTFPQSNSKPEVPSRA